MIYELDTDAVKKYAEQLMKLRKSAFPSAVRATLTGTAFDVKTKTLLESAKKKFVERDKNFFKANSTVEKADGWNISTMEAKVGMYNGRLQGANNHAVEDLEQQENGGKIDGRSFIAQRTNRTGRNNNKKVKSNARMSTINNANFTQLNRRSAKSRSQQFIRAAMYAIKNTNGYVLGHQTQKGGRTLWKVDSISINIKTRKMKLKATPLYNVKKNRSVYIHKRTHFMREAAEKSASGMNIRFRKEAEFQINKIMK